MDRVPDRSGILRGAIIVTGCSRGLGSNIAAMLLSMGQNVVGVARSDIADWQIDSVTEKEIVIN
jgi:short-subunit dehydrogenase